VVKKKKVSVSFQQAKKKDVHGQFEIQKGGEKKKEKKQQQRRGKEKGGA